MHEKDLLEKMRGSGFNVRGEVTPSDGTHLTKYNGAYFAMCIEEPSCSETGFLLNKEHAVDGFGSLDDLMIFIKSYFPEHISRQHETILIAPLD